MSSFSCSASFAGSTLDAAGFDGALVAGVSAAIAVAGIVAKSTSANSTFFMSIPLGTRSSAARKRRRNVRLRSAPTGQQRRKGRCKQRRHEQPELLRRERPGIDGNAFLLRHPPRENGSETVRQQQAQH